MGDPVFVTFVLDGGVEVLGLGVGVELLVDDELGAGFVVPVDPVELDEPWDFFLVFLWPAAVVLVEPLFEGLAEIELLCEAEAELDGVAELLACEPVSLLPAVLFRATVENPVPAAELAPIA